MAAQRRPPEPASGRRTTWMEMCLEDVGAHFGFTVLVPDGGGLDSVRLALSWRLALDFVLGHLLIGPWEAIQYKKIWIEFRLETD